MIRDTGKMFLIAGAGFCGISLFLFAAIGDYDDSVRITSKMTIFLLTIGIGLWILGTMRKPVVAGEQPSQVAAFIRWATGKGMCPYCEENTLQKMKCSNCEREFSETVNG